MLGCRVYPPKRSTPQEVSMKLLPTLQAVSIATPKLRASGKKLTGVRTFQYWMVMSNLRG